MAPAALLTRISIGPPSPSTASGTIRWRSASSARLPTMVVTVAPCFSRRAAVSSSDPARFLCFSAVRAGAATAAAELVGVLAGERVELVQEDPHVVGVAVDDVE